ncbi:hypothetical protein IVA86_33205 [Bradyrhizobium sp. 146]|uniref:hypothetical protein n=1 Tax=Bradyrhizobium sp. 146 TaxID=2782622 RepID=UPI001FFB3413|nr:hypothetical protein [Bradyrhizobium sp. 146]MCK1706132.1 hypothetical protein [Bradyrhizobium sp. 146]
MAEKVTVDLGGKSKYEVAHTIALQIITVVEGKNLADVSRQHYLHAIADAIDALHSIKN